MDNIKIDKSQHTLDFDKETFRSLMARSSDLIARLYDNVMTQKGFHDYPQAEVYGWFDEKIPLQGTSMDELFNLVEEKVFNSATGNIGPNMYAYVMSGGNQVGIVGDQLCSAINQNVAKWHLSPSITEIDKRVIQWAAEMIGYGENVGGFIGSSGSAANLDGLTVARNMFLEQRNVRDQGLFGMTPIIIYCSDQTHNSVDKAVQLLGIGRDNLRKIETNEDLTINISELRRQIRRDIDQSLQPFCIIGNAGTVNTGAIDDLRTLSLMAKDYNMWFHVDGAYGGLAACLETKRSLYRGIESADSVALDFHKWLYQPFEVGCLLVKKWDHLNRCYFQKASYLDKSLENSAGRLEFNEHHFLLSRNAKSLKVWMTLKAYGLNKIKEMIQKDIDLTRYLNEKVEKAADFELVADSPLAICCFRYKGTLTEKESIVDLNRRLIPALETDGRVFITGTTLKGEFALRACLINHRKNQETTDYLLEVIRNVGQRILNEN